ncbi:MAG: class I SAM-dependent methyltransferase [Nanoarchaeota archaeon]
MESEDQRKVWDDIAPEWDEFKHNTDKRVLNFLETKGGNVLDLGCASGRFFVKSSAKFYGVDFSQEMLNIAKKNAIRLGVNFEGFKVDLSSENLPFKDDFFDRIICVAVLHCITSEKGRTNLLKEIKRVLKKDGKALIKVWNRSSKRFGGKEEKFISWRDKGKRYYYFYSPEELKKELEKFGFKILEFEHKNSEGFETQEIFVVVGK